MSFLSEKKAQEVFELYKAAELSGDNEKAEAYLKQLTDAKWKVVWTPEWGIAPADNRLFSNLGNNQPLIGMFNNDVQTAPYRGSTSTNRKVPTWAWITMGAIALTILTIVIIYKIKKSRNGGFEKIQGGLESV